MVDPNRLLLIAGRGCPPGQTDGPQAASAKVESGEVAVDLWIDRCLRGNGLAAELVRLGLQAMEKCWGSAPEAVAEVLSSNTARNSCFTRACFTRDTELLSDFTPPGSGSESLALAPSRITLLSDSGSWLNAFLPDLLFALWQRGHAVRWIHTPSALCAGDVCLLLSCGRLLNPQQLALHRHNLVVHASALPQGQGWSPMTWQILEGASSIPITLLAVANYAGSTTTADNCTSRLGAGGGVATLLAQATSDLCQLGSTAMRMSSSAQP